MLAILNETRTLDDLREKQREALKLLELRIAELERDEVDIRRLIVEQVLSHDIEEYAVETHAALAALKPFGLHIISKPGLGYVLSTTDCVCPATDAQRSADQ